MEDEHVNLCGTLTIGAHDITVMESTRDDLHDERDLQGLADKVNNTITVIAEGSTTRKVEIIWHEIFHFMLGRLLLGEEPEELLCHHLGEELRHRLQGYSH